MDIDERTELCFQMLSCCHQISYWVYDSFFHVISTNAASDIRDSLEIFFDTTRTGLNAEKDILKDRTPFIMENIMELIWIIVPCFRHEEAERFYVIGPLITGDVSFRRIESLLLQHHLSKENREKISSLLSGLPVISFTRILEYSLMLYHCVTNEQITVSDIRYSKHSHETTALSSSKKQDQHGTYLLEREMLRIVREGDIASLKGIIHQISSSGQVGRLSRDNALIQSKNAAKTCAILFSRAAIEGGLSPELSYSLTDKYFQSIESAVSLSEVGDISRSLQMDFVRRVHQIRMTGYSKPIQTCCDFITAHLEEPLPLSLLCEVTGYSSSHLSRTFRAQTGITLREYILEKRLEYSRFLLSDHTLEIQSISERLQFCSQSYYSECFRKKYAMSPTDYRRTC